MPFLKTSTGAIEQPLVVISLNIQFAASLCKDGWGCSDFTVQQYQGFNSQRLSLVHIIEKREYEQCGCGSGNEQT